MCGRYASSATPTELADLFGVEDVPDPLPGPRYNIAPTDPVPAVLSRRRESGLRRLLVPVRWGLVPSWSKNPSGGARMINARVETVSEKPAFRSAFAKRRCLLPADGYYEWYPFLDSVGRTIKQPYFIAPAEGGVLAMAGVYEFWKAPDGTWLTSAAIITTAATDALGHLHDRTPMTVAASDWTDWLDPGFADDPRGLLAVAVDELDYHRVSTAVNRVGTDGPELVVPLPGDAGGIAGRPAVVEKA